MKFYSELTKEFYDSEKDCVKAEKLHNDKLAKEKLEKQRIAEERKEAAAKVEAVYDAYLAAKEAYINELCKKYGSYNTSITSKDLASQIDSMFSMFFN